MTFSTREVTARLVNGEIIFWTGEVNRRDASQNPVVGLFDGCFACQGFPLIDLDEATPLRITLLNQIALHLKHFITGSLSLARE